MRFCNETCIYNYKLNNIDIKTSSQNPAHVSTLEYIVWLSVQKVVAKYLATYKSIW